MGQITATRNLVAIKVVRHAGQQHHTNSSNWCHPIVSYICLIPIKTWSLQWRHNERDGVSNHQPHDCLLNDLFRHRSKKTSKLRVTGLCEGNSPVIGEFPAQRDSNAENVSIWWRHHDIAFDRVPFSNSFFIVSFFPPTLYLVSQVDHQK